MKNIILILFLSFVALSCSKDKTEPKEEITDTRIKNDIPPKLLGKWKQVAEREESYTTGEAFWYKFETGQEYDLFFKEYSICCNNNSDNNENCDNDTYSAKKIDNNDFFEYEIVFTFCGENSSSSSNLFRILKGGKELIFHGQSIETFVERKYIKVE